MRNLIFLVIFGLIVLFNHFGATDNNTRLLELNKLMNSGNDKAFLTGAKKYVKSYPKSCKGYNMLGWAHAALNNHQEAEAAFDKAIELDPKWDNAHVGKGVLYRKQGKLKKARESYLKAIKILPKNAEAYSSLLVIELMQGNDKKAVEYGEKAWEMRKDMPIIAANLSIAYHYIGDHKKRDKFYETAKKLGYPSLQSMKDIFSGKFSLR